MGLFSAQIATKSMVPLCRQLATSYDAGIPILRALSLVRDGTRDKRAREVLEAMADQVRNGATLGDAARSHQKYLPRYFIELLSAGEMSGRLSVMLRDLAEYYEDQLTMRRSIVGSLVYPGIQLAAAWFLGTFALRLIRRLDFTGKTQFDFWQYLVGYGYFQLKAMCVLAAVFALCAGLARLGVWKWIWGWFTNFVWPIKTVTRKFALARFFRSMSLLIGSGMNIKSCIINSAAITVNPYIERDLLQAVPLVAEGATLMQAFAVTRSLTPVAREMIFVGEQSGNLEQSLLKVSQYHLEEANQAVKIASRVMGVLILLILAGLVGYIYITFFMTYYGRMLDSLG